MSKEQSKLVLKLDKSRYFSTVHGEATQGLAYVQDGLPFGHDHVLLDAQLTADQQALVKKKLARLSKFAQPGSNDEGQTGSAQKAEKDSEIDENVNLLEWAKGELRYEPNVIFKEMKARYSKVFTTVREAAEFLIDEKVVSMEEVSPALFQRS
jgi:hypothetical protein